MLTADIRKANAALVKALRTDPADADRWALVHCGNLSRGVHSGGPFAGFLFFSAGREGASGPGTLPDAPCYYFNPAPFAVAEPQRWPWDDAAQPVLAAAVPDAMDALGTDDEDEAYAALCDGDYDASGLDDPWAIQRLTCEVARVLGYAVVELSDEHGTSYGVDAVNPDVVIFDEAGTPVPVKRR